MRQLNTADLSDALRFLPDVSIDDATEGQEVTRQLVREVVARLLS